MIQEFIKGGGIMWFLLACAILGIALVIERFITLFIVASLNAKKFTNNLISVIEKEGLESGIKMCQKTKSPVVRVLLAALEKAKEGKTAMEEAVTRAGVAELGFLDRGMSLMGGLTMVAPFFGFLGTVTGMIRAFAAVAAVGEVEPTVVASGISEALITTKWGLMIAAPLAIIHTLYQMKINSYTRDLETAAATLIEYLTKRQ
ncbi:MAG: MotA/TolQ/ExbB proton channel family protein [candidate division WOR-3 bacterium]|nr:MotA/TolQ/ExbB proton channel family protein [candidate division WOR-3 bacterium]MDW8113839.1 MotA/TolQ/ExbB proton channel family protein [candidate division WOR-3 bacterium]